MVALMVDLLPPDVYLGGPYFTSHKVLAKALMELSELRSRWPGLERERRVNFDDLRFALMVEEPLPNPIASHCGKLVDGMRELAGQASTRVTLAVPHGYDIRMGGIRSCGWGPQTISDGNGRLTSDANFVRWSGLFAVQHDHPDQGVVFYSFRPTAGTDPRSVLNSGFLRLEFSDGLKIDRTNPKAWNVALPPAVQ
jgi:hypothetical protein